MKVTSISPQVKRPDRYSIFIDEAYTCSLSADELLRSGLTVGAELSKEDVTKLQDLSASDKAYGLAIAYVARCMRSRGELKDYFARKQYDPELSSQLLSRLDQAGLIDDEQFAMLWIENRRMLKHASSTRIRAELAQKKVSKEIIDKYIGSDMDSNVLAGLVEKKRRQTKYQDDQKLMAYLARQGFKYDEIKKALS